MASKQTDDDGRSPFNQKFRNYGNETTGMQTSLESFREIECCWISEMRTIQPYILVRRLPEMFEILGIPREVVRKFKPQFFVEWKLSDND